MKKTRRTQQERREESETRLFGALVDILNNQGISSATCAQIGEQAGYSRGLISARLGKRDEMFDRLIHRLKKKQVELMEAVAEKSGEAGHLLREYARIHFEELRADDEYRAFFVLVAGAVAERNMNLELIIDAHYVIRDSLASAVSMGIASGEFDSSHDAEKAALLIGTHFLGAAMSMHLAADQDHNLYANGIDVIVSGLRQPKLS